jgi:hypothetical protein
MQPAPSEHSSAPRAADPHRAARWRFAGMAARVIVGGLFISTALSKIVDPLSFAKEIQDYQLAPIVVTHALALILPWLEGLSGALLIATAWRREARLVIAGLLVVFTLAKAYVYLVLGKTGACGCGGESVVLSTLLNNPQGLLTNLVLLGLLWLDALAERKAQRRKDTRKSEAPVA